jgi:hypothetical protein
MIAQALVEKGLLDGALAGLSSAFDTGVMIFQEQPWLIAVIVAVAGFFLFRPRY